MNTDNRDLEKLFGKSGMSFVPILRGLLSTIPTYSYSFMPDGAFKQLLTSSMPEAMRVYWRETVMRAHLASVASLLRGMRWVEGALGAYRASNFLVFSASLRGLLEAAADSHDALRHVSLTLAQCHTWVKRALSGGLREAIVCQELEDCLIHFSHARRIAKHETAPDTHRAKTTRDYIAEIEKPGSRAVGDCYADLCETTHPAASSVYSFVALDDVTGMSFKLRQDRDVRQIEEFCAHYSDVMPALFQLHFNPPTLILRVINRLEVPEYVVNYVESLDMSGVPAWAKIKAAFGTPSSLPSTARS